MVLHRRPTMRKPTKEEPGEKTFARNRRAGFDYILGARFEAGLVLRGSEVKSIRAGAISLVDGFASVEPDGVYLRNVTIEPLPHAAFGHEPRRPRKLLLRAREIGEIRKAVEQGQTTLVPISVYLKGGLIKTEVALGRGKKKGDKRDAIKTREAQRDARSAMRRSQKE
jgi:SsrA-binding protein